MVFRQIMLKGVQNISKYLSNYI